MTFKLIKTELKRNLYSLPAVLAGAVLLGALIAALIFTASSILYRSEPLVRANVAVVNNSGADEYVEYAMDYLSNMTSASLVLDFELTDAETAEKNLSSGDVIAIITFPEGMISGILYGSNIPAEVTIPDGDSLSSLFLSELLKDSVSLLSSAQGDTYTAAELYYSFEKGDKLDDAYNRIDLINLSHVAEREKVFKTVLLIPGLDPDIETVKGDNINGDTSVPVTLIYYLSSGLILFIIFLGTCFIQTLKYENSSFYACLFVRKTNPVIFVLIRFITNTLVFALFCFVIRFIAGFAISEKTVFELPSYTAFLLLTAFTSTLGIFLNIAAKNAPLAVLFQFLLGTAMLLISGGIIPSSFMPVAIRNIGRFLPTYHLQHNMILGMLGFPHSSVNSALHLIIWILILLAGTMGILTYRSKKGTL
ncbi:MAG: ABC transporter permease [Lachnospiraceae bacterium]|nr:ABC transporter permease [Lachnospiraceae bacterium]